MSRIVVTGATGFAGLALCRTLREGGHEVIALARSSSDTTMLRSIGVPCRSVDLTKPHSFRNLLERVDRLYHLAAAYRVEHADRREFVRINVDATGNLCEAARASGVGRFIHVSTVGVQGEIESPPADEDYRFQPGDHYQESKLRGERLAREHFQSGLSGVVVRPVGLYGPGDLRFLKLFRAIARRRFVMVGSGETLYHLTYIDDLVRGLLLAGEVPAAIGNVFTIAGPRYTTLNDLVRRIAATLGVPPPRARVPLAPVWAASIVCYHLCRAIHVNPPIYPRRVEFFKLDRAFRIDRARRVLGYEPRVDLDEGLRRTAGWYREEGLL
jgi:nucleoside-diphosphate-sugar epimerase